VQDSNAHALRLCSGTTHNTSRAPSYALSVMSKPHCMRVWQDVEQSISVVADRQSIHDESMQVQRLLKIRSTQFAQIHLCIMV